MYAHVHVLLVLCIHVNTFILRQEDSLSTLPTVTITNVCQHIERGPLAGGDDLLKRRQQGGAPANYPNRGTLG